MSCLNEENELMKKSTECGSVKMKTVFFFRMDYQKFTR